MTGYGTGDVERECLLLQEACDSSLCPCSLFMSWLWTTPRCVLITCVVTSGASEVESVTLGGILFWLCEMGTLEFCQVLSLLQPWCGVRCCSCSNLGMWWSSVFMG